MKVIKKIQKLQERIIQLAYLRKLYVEKERRTGMDFLKLLSNSTRMRIMQYLQAHGDVTSRQISDFLSDVPVPTLYRHINYLIDVGLVTIKEERKVRGSLERLLSINHSKLNESGDISDTAYQFLMDIYIKFYNYNQKPDNDPVKDKLMLRTITLNLNDSDMDAMLYDIKLVLERYVNITKNSKDKLRSISIISAPLEP